MRLYSDFPLARSGQIAADLIAVASVALFVALGVATHALITGFAELGSRLEDAGSGFRQTMTDAADTLGAVPLLGSGIRTPFDNASGAGAALQQAGQDQQDAVAQAAVIVGLVVAVVPIALIVRFWLLRRIAFARRATEAASLARLDGGLDLLALRALAARAPSEIVAVDPDATGAWRRGDPVVIASLAALALRDAGVRG